MSVAIKYHRANGSNTMEYVDVDIVYSGTTYKQTVVTPQFATEQEYVDHVTASENRYLFDLVRALYPDAIGADLAEVEAWITANPTVDPEVWVNTHPKEAGTEYQTDLQSYKDSPLYNKTQVQIDTYIDSMTTVAKLKGALKEVTRVIKIMMHNIED